VKALFILNDPPHGSERCYNALRLANVLLKKEPETSIAIFLMLQDRGSPFWLCGKSTLTAVRGRTRRLGDFERGPLPRPLSSVSSVMALV